MEKILFVNACVRKESRTLFLAGQLLDRLQGEITELELQREELAPLNRESLERRNQLLCEKNLEDASLGYAHQFAQADIIVESV